MRGTSESLNFSQNLKKNSRKEVQPKCLSLVVISTFAQRVTVQTKLPSRTAAPTKFVGEH